MCTLKRELQGELQVNVIIKDNDGGNGDIGIDLSAHEIDAFVEQPYDHQTLERMLSEVPK